MNSLLSTSLSTFTDLNTPSHNLNREKALKEEDFNGHREYRRRSKQYEAEHITSDDRNNSTERIYDIPVIVTKTDVDCRHHQRRKKTLGAEVKAKYQDQLPQGVQQHNRHSQFDDVVWLREHPKVERTSRSYEVINIPIDRPGLNYRRRSSEIEIYTQELLMKKSERGFDKPKPPPGRYLFNQSKTIRIYN